MNWGMQRHDGAALRGPAGRYNPDDGGLTMDPAAIALAGSLLANLVLIWKLIDANYRAALLRADINY